MEKLGIAAELKPRVRPVSASAGQGSPRVGEVVAKGEAEIGMQPISELMEVGGIDIVGPLPAALQSPDLVYVAGSSFVSEQPIAAKALIDFLAGPAAAAVYKAKGLEPGINYGSIPSACTVSSPVWSSTVWQSSRLGSHRHAARS